MPQQTEIKKFLSEADSPISPGDLLQQYIAIPDITEKSRREKCDFAIIKQVASSLIELGIQDPELTSAIRDILISPEYREAHAKHLEEIGSSSTTALADALQISPEGLNTLFTEDLGIIPFTIDETIFPYGIPIARRGDHTGVYIKQDAFEANVLGDPRRTSRCDLAVIGTHIPDYSIAENPFFHLLRGIIWTNTYSGSSHKNTNRAALVVYIPEDFWYAVCSFASSNGLTLRAYDPTLEGFGARLDLMENALSNYHQISQEYKDRIQLLATPTQSLFLMRNN